jgi:hypothetical protein
MHQVQAFKRRRIALLRKPDRLGFRYFSRFGSSRSGHATRWDASLNAMRRLLQKLSLTFLPRNYTAPGRWWPLIADGPVLMRGGLASLAYFRRNCTLGLAIARVKLWH